MRRLIAAVLLVLLMLGLALAAQGTEFALSGRLSATDQEADEGYFAIDQQTMLVVKPGSELHAYLRGQMGKRIRIVVEPATEVN